jgi:hypothetical protein
VSCYCEGLCGANSKMCLEVLYFLSFSVLLRVKDDGISLGLNVLSNCSSISVFTASMLVMIGYVRER